MPVSSEGTEVSRLSPQSGRILRPIAATPDACPEGFGDSCSVGVPLQRPGGVNHVLLPRPTVTSRSTQDRGGKELTDAGNEPARGERARRPPAGAWCTGRLLAYGAAVRQRRVETGRVGGLPIRRGVGAVDPRPRCRCEGDVWPKSRRPPDPVVERVGQVDHAGIEGCQLVPRVATTV